jgi:nicotinamidase-related amidase
MEKHGLKLDPEGWFGISDSEWINRRATALLIIDMQRYDADRNWALIGTRGTGTPDSSSDYYYSRIEKTVVPSIKRLLACFRSYKMPVFHLFFASCLPGAPDMPPLWRLRFDQHAEDSGNPFTPYADLPGMEIIDELKPAPGEPVLSKVTGGAFASTRLDTILKNMGIKSFTACGVWMNSCVEDTIRAGCDLGYLVTLAEDASAAPDKEFHNACVRVLGEMYCQVRETDWIINKLGAL